MKKRCLKVNNQFESLNETTQEILINIIKKNLSLDLIPKMLELPSLLRICIEYVDTCSHENFKQVMDKVTLDQMHILLSSATDWDSMIAKIIQNFNLKFSTLNPKEYFYDCEMEKLDKDLKESNPSLINLFSDYTLRILVNYDDPYFYR